MRLGDAFGALALISTFVFRLIEYREPGLRELVTNCLIAAIVAAIISGAGRLLSWIVHGFVANSKD